MRNVARYALLVLLALSAGCRLQTGIADTSPGGGNPGASPGSTTGSQNDGAVDGKGSGNPNVTGNRNAVKAEPPPLKLYQGAGGS